MGMGLLVWGMVTLGVLAYHYAARQSGSYVYRTVADAFDKIERWA